MLFPIADDNSDRTTTPVVNYLLILANILVFVFLQNFGANDKFTYAYSVVPYEIVNNQDLAKPVAIHDFSGRTIGRINLQPTPIPVYLTLITSMFMHGGLAHIFGNMLFLFIFGDNIEDRMGHFRYLIFYLLCGVLAGLAHVYATALFATDTASLIIPSLGASGAISGVLGAYLLLFPTRRVILLISWFPVTVPAFIAIGLWFVFQVINGLGLLGSGSQQGGGVAYAAHIGGFVAGLALIYVFLIGRKPKPRPSRWDE
jgi:membrane associated rhomboid family serine protease